MQNILVTGASGFLGRNLMMKLSKNKKFTIYGLIHSSKKNLIKKKNIHYIKGDISKLRELKKILNKDFNYIINLAGNINHRSKTETYNSHYKGLQNLIKVIEVKKIKLFIQIGSSLEYGKTKAPHYEYSKCKPNSYYGKSKFLASKLVQKKFKKFIILRLYQVYGPHQKKNRLVPIIIDSCKKNISFACTDGSQLRDFLFVDDFVQLILKILKIKKLKNGVFNVGCGKPISVRTVINKIKFFIKKGKPLFGKIKMRKDETLISYPKISKINKALKWKPKTTLETGLKKTINFYE